MLSSIYFINIKTLYYTLFICANLLLLTKKSRLIDHIVPIITIPKYVARVQLLLHDHDKAVLLEFVH